MMNRREFITLSSIAAITLLSGCGGGSGNSGNGRIYTPVTSNPLPIPSLLEGVLRNGVMHYDMTLQRGSQRFFEGVDTATYGINGNYLGPTLLLKKEDSVSLNYTNLLGETTTMHGHGMHLPGEMDGTTHQPIAPNATWSSQFTVNQTASTNWYHPHYMHKTAKHVYQGLAGAIIIEDSDSQTLDLPNRYGIDDIPVVLQDRFFSADKRSLLYAPSRRELMRGYIGDTFIANGAIDPVFEAEAKHLRLRLLNGSNSTVYQLGFDDGRSFVQIAGDNSFLEHPVSMSRITLSPGERAEIIIDLSNDLDRRINLQEYNHGKRFMQIKVTKTAQTTETIPTQLVTLEPIPTATTQRTFTLGMAGMGSFTINGKSMDPNRIDVALSQGDVEEWEIINQMMVDHNFHIHGTHFRVISRNNDTNAVHENEKGYKDTVYIPANERVKVIVAIPSDGITADSNNPYMFHCHFLEHEDNGMMGQYTVS